MSHLTVREMTHFYLYIANERSFVLRNCCYGYVS